MSTKPWPMISGSRERRARVTENTPTAAPTFPILFMNGTEDPIVPYEGGAVVALGFKRGTVLSTERSAAIFGEHNGCTGIAADVPLHNWARRDGTRVIVQRGTGCVAPVVVYRVEGGGHTWPGGKQYLPVGLIGRVSRDISGTKHIFNFFAKQKLP